MKNIKIILIAVLGIFAISSCEDFLDKKPTNAADSAEAIKSVDDAELFMKAISSKMLSTSYLGQQMHLYADAKGGDLTIQSAGRGYDALYSFNHTVSSGTYSSFWTQGFNIILQLNTLLTNIETLEAAGTTEDFDNVKGQALTLRGMLYFDLVRLYGEPYNEDKSAWGVPNITTVLSADARELRATVQENYTQILTDLKAGEPLLTKNVTHGFVNYWANKALQARVYLHMDDFDNALAAAKDVIKNGPYDLYENDEWVASWATKTGKESIFQLTVLATEGGGSSALGGIYSRRAHYSSSIGGYYMASEYFLERLGEDPDDVRWGIMTHDETSEDRLGCCYKYLGSVDMSGDGEADAAACNVKVIRLSEMYLIASEAALRKSSADEAAAADYLNAIRKRSPNLAPATEATITLDMILDEKSKEFLCEGQRFWDLIRCNKTIEFNDDWQGVPIQRRGKTIDRTSHLTILPIFQAEINANPDIEAQQNPGY